MAQTTSFTTPGMDYGVELGQIERKRALVQALQQQSMQPIEQQTAGGWVVKNSPLQGVAKLAQAFAAKKGEQRADAKQQQLNEKIQSDYRNMLAKGLGQLQGTPARTINPDPQESQQSADYGTPQVGPVHQPAQAPDPMGAIATFGSHPMGQQLMPLAMEEIKRKQLIEALKGAQGGIPGSAPQPSPMNPAGANPSVMAGSGGQGYTPTQPQAAAGTHPLGPASGIPMEAWLATDPTGKSYLSHLADQGKTSGRVNYDQQGRAFTVAGNGAPIYLQGISARDKPEAVNLGGTTQFVNPYQAGGQSLQHTPTIGNQLEAANVYHNTGLNPLGMGVGRQPAPGGQPQPAAAPGRPPQANPNARLTPKQQQELEANRPHAEAAAKAVLQANERLTNTANELHNHPGLSGITGKINQYSAGDVFPETRAARGLQSTMVKQVGIQTLQAMRDASKTGGAVGNVTEKEWPILQQSIAALDDAQSTGDYQKALENLVAQIKSSSERVRQAYEQTYGGLNYQSVPHTPQGRSPTAGGVINWSDLERGR